MEYQERSEISLCTMEKYFILFDPYNATLNLRSEFFSHCRLKEKHLPFKSWQVKICIVIVICIVDAVTKNKNLHSHEDKFKAVDWVLYQNWADHDLLVLWSSLIRQSFLLSSSVLWPHFRLLSSSNNHIWCSVSIGSWAEELWQQDRKYINEWHPLHWLKERARAVFNW